MGKSQQQRVAAILAQYPQAVVVAQSRRLRTFNQAACDAIAVTGVGLYWGGSQIGPCLILVALWWLWIIVGMAGRVTLDTEGFAIEKGRLTDRWRWSDVGNFRAEFTGDVGDVTFEVRRDVAGEVVGPAEAVDPRRVRMRNGYGLTHGALLALMEQWQKRAIEVRATAE